MSTSGVYILKTKSDMGFEYRVSYCRAIEDLDFPNEFDGAESMFGRAKVFSEQLKAHKEAKRIGGKEDSTEYGIVELDCSNWYFPGSKVQIHVPEFVQPNCIRYFLLVNRLPAVDKCVVISMVGNPKCFATYKGKRVRLTMASRFCDVGITYDLEAESGYKLRVSVDSMTDFSEIE